jgi:deoxyribodipyrimidine photo-lyase
VAQARALGKPLVVLEALRVGYPWASDRLHQFVIDGMAANQRALAGRTAVTYFPYLEPAPGEGKGLLKALAAHAAVVVTDDFPSFFLPRMTEAAADQLDVRLDVVDSNGLLPIRAVETVFPTAYAFRRACRRHCRRTCHSARPPIRSQACRNWGRGPCPPPSPSAGPT